MLNPNLTWIFTFCLLITNSVGVSCKRLVKLRLVIMEKFWTRLGLPNHNLIMFVLNILLQVIYYYVIYHYVLSCSYHIIVICLFICLWQRFGVVIYYSVAILSDCRSKSCYSYYTFYFIGKKNNFEKHPDYVPSVFRNKQQAKRVITPS